MPAALAFVLDDVDVADQLEGGVYKSRISPTPGPSGKRF
jgi:hypothetical protein